MTIHDSFREVPEPGQLYKQARAQQIENDRQSLERAKLHLLNIPATNQKAMDLQHATIERLQKIVDEEYLHV